MSAAEDLTRAASGLQSLLRKPSASAEEVRKASSVGKRVLLTHNLLIPSGTAPSKAHAAARFILEASALLALRLQDPDGFQRYWGALAPFYELGKASYPSGEARGQRAKITGLYLLLLLTRGDYAGFHTLIEALQAEAEDSSSEESSDDDDDDDSDSDDDSDPIVADDSIMYPIMLERCLMEGSYDRVWELVKGERLPSEEFAVFSQVLVGTIREEIASCSEKAYPSIPVHNAKNLLFLTSEGDVIQFAAERGWQVRDGRIYFPVGGTSGGSGGAADASHQRSEREILAKSAQVIENTIGYARELETIV